MRVRTAKSAHQRAPLKRSSARSTTQSLPGAPLSPLPDRKLAMQIGIRNRQRANALAGGGKDRIGDRRGDGRDGGLARATPYRSTARHQMHVDLGRIRQAHHPISIEIALHGRAILDGDLSVECRRQPKDHGALSLLYDGLRVNHVTGIEGDRDPIDLHMAVWLHRYFGDLRAETVRKSAYRDAARSLGAVVCPSHPSRRRYRAP